MSLDRYRRKRDFALTPEPAGGGARGSAPRPGRRFVVQRHRATRLHYDFRLEIDGVLMSWAVPRGPSLDPAARRMGVHVEDHPLEYFDFEGVIPRGQYGAGDVIVWDWGTFEPEETDDPSAAVRGGELKLRIQGEKLRGRFTLVRIRSDDPSKDDWLLIHKRDESAVPGWDAEEHPGSVKSGRTNDEVKAGVPALWDPDAPAAEAAIDLTGAVEAPMPDYIAPMRATAVSGVFSDEDWLFELKLDGYRVEGIVRDGKVRLWTRNKQDAARYFPDLAEARPTWIDARTAIVDGEVVALDEEGRPDFSRLQDRTGMRGLASKRGERRPSKGGGSEGMRGAPLVYFLFDLLYLDGRLLLEVPLEERKRLLRSVVRDHPAVRYLSHIEADGESFHAAAGEKGLEGIVAKLRRSRYEPDRRARTWLKLKIRREQELVVGGYEPGQGSHADLGSLIVGVYEGKRLVFCGHVGSGIDTRTRRDLVRRLDELRIDAPPFSEPPPIRNARWVEPRVVIRAEFAEWTRDDLLRQASYKGEEIGRDPKSVVRERAVPVGPTVAAAEREATSTARAEKPAQAGKLAQAGKPVPPARRRGSRRLAAPGAAGLVRDPQDIGDPAEAVTRDELDALDSLGAAGTWSVGGHDVSLTNLDKVLFPAAGYTKRDLVRYYATMSPILLPYLRGRPLNTDRWPNGVDGGHFWQKQIPSHAPQWVARWDYPEAGSTESHTYVVADRVATMAWLANQAVIDLHPWTSRCESYRSPTYALIDIDPGERTTWEQVTEFARLYRTALEHLGVTGFPKVTGKRGVQIWVPIADGYTFDQTRDWVGQLSKAVGGAMPELVSWEWEKAGRGGRARLDYTQNAVNKTLVAPYAVRPVKGASVSAPIEWEELDDPELRPDRWDLRSMVERVEQRGDLFAGALELRQALPGL
ncbi:MAG: DNA ligase D [Chloroflexi bacterium]|nr:DNA ligase D [Chloroflexota bacterium]